MLFLSYACLLSSFHINLYQIIIIIWSLINFSSPLTEKTQNEEFSNRNTIVLYEKLVILSLWSIEMRYAIEFTAQLTINASVWCKVFYYYDTPSFYDIHSVISIIIMMLMPIMKWTNMRVDIFVFISLLLRSSLISSPLSGVREKNTSIEGIFFSIWLNIRFVHHIYNELNFYSNDNGWWMEDKEFYAVDNNKFFFRFVR